MRKKKKAVIHQACNCIVLWVGDARVLVSIINFPVGPIMANTHTTSIMTLFLLDDPLHKSPTIDTNTHSVGG